MKKIAFALIILLVSCNTYKSKFVMDDDDTNIEKLNRMYAKANYLKEEQLWLIFYTGFKNTRVIISENETVKFDSIISTKNQYPYFADVFKIDKNSLISVKFDSVKKPLTITKSKMAKYKSIYITKKINKFEIEFTNGNKPRIDYSKANRKIWNKQAKKAIRDSIKLLKNVK